MGSKNQTTVVLTSEAEPIREKLAPMFGLKNVVSAGLVALNKLSRADLMRIVAEAMGRPDSRVAFYADREKLFELKQLLDHERMNPQLGEGEKALFDDLLGIIGFPEAVDRSWSEDKGSNRSLMQDDLGPFFDVVGEMLEADRSGVRVLSKEQQKAAKSFRKAFAPTAEEIVDGAVGDVKAGKQNPRHNQPKTG